MKQHQRGFSIAGILIVLSIIGILMFGLSGLPTTRMKHAKCESLGGIMVILGSGENVCVRKDAFIKLNE